MLILFYFIFLQRQVALELFEDPMSLFSGFYPLVEEEPAAQEVPSGLECAPQGRDIHQYKFTSVMYCTHDSKAQ